VQNLLTARVDRLSPEDRALLQAAAVMGRRFDPELLAAVVDDADDIDARLAAMQALDLVRAEPNSADYSFKHALVRDALYQSLLTEARKKLHARIAEEIESRSDNRLTEVAEALAYHYSHTDRANKAFTYLAMAGAKSLGVYSLEEANNFFTAAIAVLDKTPDCADDQQIVDFLGDYTLNSNISSRFRSTTESVERFFFSLNRVSNCYKWTLVQHHYIFALILSARYREAEVVQANLSAMVANFDDARSTAYALATAIYVSTVIAPQSVENFETLSQAALTAASNINDVYLQCFIPWAIGWEELHRGRVAKAQRAADELMAVGRRLNDPRSIAYAMGLETWIALASDDYLVALNLAETSLNIARTPYDQQTAETGRIVALVLLRRPDALPLLRDWMNRCAANNWRYLQSGCDGIYGVGLVINGEISRGIRWLEEAILRREQEGYRMVADWYRMYLCEIYIEIISGKEKPSINVLFRNAFTLIVIILRAERRISNLVELVRQNPRFDPSGHFIGRCEMILGLLYKTKRKKALAVRHLSKAKLIASQFGQAPMLAKIDAALAELG